MSEQDVYVGRPTGFYQATSTYPSVRDEEVELLLKGLLKKELKDLCIINSQGGFFYDALKSTPLQLNSVVLLESSTELLSHHPYSALRKHIQLDKLSEIEDSYDSVLCLAGLHHCNSYTNVFNGLHSILKKGGLLRIAEVEEGSEVCVWLNTYVNKWTTSGHRGNFLKLEQVEQLCKPFSISSIHRATPTWRFKSADESADFFRLFFGLKDVSNFELISTMREVFRTRTTNDGFELEWPLISIECLK